ncbi:hypothetical protein MPTK1_4g18410 [Marchantia polymorpha subsp. ruderalis]|uniref:Uncharacterized protein n=2 Tax=Marchantia polymorpha TaxID=3197 RepID=A0AAF6BB92_MARPO|nr:hypothetical protein MARPO_0041s0122 [Marchantia polymorpha]BBN09276.1 hypothetical protein Mp_4g18410 [Marchantia polymorpha subsp. ruderalis]|eukprot:PTQ40263.1 hypothetical protein MARPO_0041s0122 [Marchantia polymorpha]
MCADFLPMWNMFHAVLLFLFLMCDTVHHAESRSVSIMRSRPITEVTPRVLPNVDSAEAAAHPDGLHSGRGVDVHMYKLRRQCGRRLTAPVSAFVESSKSISVQSPLATSSRSRHNDEGSEFNISPCDQSAESYAADHVYGAQQASENHPIFQDSDPLNPIHQDSNRPSSHAHDHTDYLDPEVHPPGNYEG